MPNELCGKLGQFGHVSFPVPSHWTCKRTKGHSGNCYPFSMPELDNPKPDDDVLDWTPEQRDDLAQVQGMFQRLIEQANQLQSRIKFLEDEETSLLGRLARALGHDGKEAIGVDQMIQEVGRLAEFKNHAR